MTTFKKSCITAIILLAVFVGAYGIGTKVIDRRMSAERQTENETITITETSVTETSAVMPETTETTVVTASEETTVETTKAETTTEKITETRKKSSSSEMKTDVTEMVRTEKTECEVVSGDGKNLGTFRITCYTPYSDGGVWGYATCTGVRSTHLATCAVDPNVIPLGSTIMIGDLTLRCVDVGGAVKGNKIDIFFDGTDSEARVWLDNFGEYRDVVLV